MADTQIKSFQPTHARRSDGVRLACPSAEHANTTTLGIFEDADASDVRLYLAADTAKKVGQTFEFTFVPYVVDNNSTDTLVCRMVMDDGTNTNVLYTTTAKDVGDGETGSITVRVEVITLGSTGTARLYVTGAHNFAGTYILADGAAGESTVTVDWTAQANVYVDADWSVAHADNQARLDAFWGRLL